MSRSRLNNNYFALRQGRTRSESAVYRRVHEHRGTSPNAVLKQKSIVETTSHQIGARVETQALLYLQQQGATLIQQNFRCRSGEIDLIMQQQDILIFIEVRFRKHTQFGGALESIDWRKRQKIIRTAQFFLKRFPNVQSAPCRFDLLAAKLDAQGLCFEWIQNAFQAF